MQSSVAWPCLAQDMLTPMDEAEARARAKAFRDCYGKEDNNDHSYDALAAEYINAARHKEATSGVLKSALAEYLRGKFNAKSAEQESQSADSASVRLRALQVAQNGRIIELLEYIAARLPKNR